MRLTSSLIEPASLSVPIIIITKYFTPPFQNMKFICKSSKSSNYFHFYNVLLFFPIYQNLFKNYQSLFLEVFISLLYHSILLSFVALQHRSLMSQAIGSIPLGADGKIQETKGEENDTHIASYGIKFSSIVSFLKSCILAFFICIKNLESSTTTLHY